MAELKNWWDQRDRFAARGLDVLMLNIDDADEKSAASQNEIARRALHKINVAFPGDVLPARSAAVLDFFQQSQMSLQTPLALPTSFLVDAHGRVSVIYKGGVTTERILADLTLLGTAEDDRPDRAAAFPGRWLRLPRGEDANVVAARLQDEALTTEAIRYIETAIELMKSGHGSRRARPVIDLWFTLARLRLQAGDSDGALVAYRQTLTLDPDHLGANKEGGKLLFDSGKPSEAKPLLETAIRLDPNASGSFNLLALIELQIGTPARAIELAEQSVEIAPGDASAHFSLGLSCQQAGHWRRALAAYRQTLELSHAWLVARSNMAWILSTAPDASVRDGALALKLALPLAELKTRDRPLFLRTLAAAHAETTDFEQAANIVRQTLKELGPNAHPLKRRLREDLRSYAAGEPVRIQAL
jgi:tetratricopeptide (TPR) repeat protein